MSQPQTQTNAGAAKTAQTVIVSYSYPTSPNACKFGFSRAGCYTVGIMQGIEPARAERGFATKAEAFAVARASALPFNRFSIQPND